MTKKQRSNTLIERFGFNDSDLKKPLHDQIMKWLNNNIHEVVQGVALDIGAIKDTSTTWNDDLVSKWHNRANEFMRKKVDRLTEEIQRLDDSISDTDKRLSNNSDSQGWIRERLDKDKTTRDTYTRILDQCKSWQGLGDPPENPILKVRKKVWESPVVSEQYKSKYTVGFLDMEVEADIASLVVGHLSEDHYDNDLIGESLPQWYVSSNDRPLHLCFEVKTELPNLGELFRQIRLYQQYKGGHYVVICPDDSEKDLLREQGVILYKCAPFSKQQGQGSLFE
jgi:hypothetical protein